MHKGPGQWRSIRAMTEGSRRFRSLTMAVKRAARSGSVSAVTVRRLGPVPDPVEAALSPPAGNVLMPDVAGLLQQDQGRPDRVVVDHPLAAVGHPESELGG